MAEQLSRYWDARGSGPAEAATIAATLDPAVTEAIEQLYAHDDAELPDPSFLNRLETTLMDTAPMSLDLPSPTAPTPLVPNGRALSPPRSPRPRVVPRASKWHRRMLSPLATAALVIIVLAGGFSAFAPGRRGSQNDAPTFIPAVSGTPATPTADEVTAETLLEIIIPAALLPRGDRAWAVFEQATSPAGSTGHWLAANSAGGPGLRVHYVLDGSIVMRAESDAQVLRAGAGSMLEGVPAGTEVMLTPGDTWIIRNETGFDAVNPTDAPTELLVWVMAHPEDPVEFLNDPLPRNWFANSDVFAPPGVAVPSGPAMLRIRRVELPVKSSLPAPANGLQYGAANLPNAQGSSVGNLSNGRLINNGRTPATVYVLNLESAEAEARTPEGGTPAP